SAKHSFQLLAVFRRQIFHCCPGQCYVRVPRCRNLGQRIKVESDRRRITPHNWPSERFRRAQFRIIPQRLPNDRQHSAARLPATEAFTNVISGWADATWAPCFRRSSSASLGRTPLECSAILPFQLLSDNSRAACAIFESGTQNQTRSASNRAAVPLDARAPTSRASLLTDAKDALRRVTISLML